jgi:uncharacterized protein YqgV (UPF0045/DUF77 family)
MQGKPTNQTDVLFQYDIGPQRQTRGLSHWDMSSGSEIPERECVMNVELEVSLYPMTEKHLQHPVGDFVELLEKHGCQVEHTPLSSIVKGESAKVFEALRLGYEQAARKSGCVLLVKACNACPL